MRIITVSRQFGSGGRELGKRLADLLSYDYYDRQIIEQLADEHDLDPAYVRRQLSHHGWQNIQLTYRHSFSNILSNPGVNTQLLLRQREIIEEIAAAGNDCVIVGRDADVILHDYHPFRIFICADMEYRVARCMKYEMKKPEEERFSERMIRRDIRLLDRRRSRLREVITGKTKGDSSSFDLIVNTSGWDIKKLVPAVAAFAGSWFEQI